MTRRFSALLGSVAVLGLARGAAAQVDVNPPLPNVMLLVDTSGSMEWVSSSPTLPTCVPGNSTGSQRSRWTELVEVLTGKVQNFSCFAQDRASAAFKTEYRLSGVDPYDADYVQPYNRILSGTCTPGPGTAPSSVYDYPSGAIKYHPYNNTATTCSFGQTNDGLMDAFADRVRFGLMTFDSHVGAGRGLPFDSVAAGVGGTWSYFFSAPAPRQGKPADCNTLQAFEVGARNAAAPPWEGRMVGFGAPAAAGAQVVAKNQQIQEILLAMRPYGPTPIAGMLDDAREYLLKDTSVDPVTGSGNFGPYADPYIVQGCRKNVVILLSDGEPNMDLRPFCAASGAQPGVCPYEKAEDISFDLNNQADPTKRVKTFVVGFALSTVNVGAGPVQCKDLTATDIDSNPASGSLCATNPNNQPLQACCNLSRIAYNGGTTRAQFASNPDELRQALSAILSQVSASTTSRTVPVFSSGASVRDNFAAAYRFFSAFEPQSFDLWKGVLQRRRFICKLDSNDNLIKPEPQPITPSQGDDFVANVNSGQGAPRRFITVVGADQAGQVHSARTQRPAGVGTDGLGTYGGTVEQGSAAVFVASVKPEALSISGTTCTAPALSAAACRDKYLKWDVGLDNGTVFHRCATPGSANCNLVGDIYHSTPRIIGKPGEFLRDESYSVFAAQNASRPLVLYTATNDGFLHAFKVAAGDALDTFKVDSLTNNELWAFIPPAVLPDIPAQYPGTHLNLLDGVPVVKDVVATALGGGAFKFERLGADAQVGKGSNGTWRSVLVAGFGPSRGGYYALDVTDHTAPRFLWQLTTDSAGAPLFGTSSGTPVITTIFMKDGASTKEVAVAVLPGGAGATATSTPCTRPTGLANDIDTSYVPRTSVPCYTGPGIESRSLTIVRLDTGEVIRTFRRTTGEAPVGLSVQNRVSTVAGLLSPVTGQPVAFPADTGSIADRIFVGDLDGNLWRVDLSSTEPANWTMSLFFDGFPTILGNAFGSGQPVQTPPILSVDLKGQITVAFSTGDQDVITATPNMKNYVWSLTETVDTSGATARFISKANWFSAMTDGERVAGAMSLFNGSLFFSSFKPEAAGSTNVCRAGSSRVWGVHYLLPKVAADLSQGGAARLPENPSATPVTLVQFIDASSPLLPDDAVIFGVGVAQTPSCNDSTSVSGDPYLGGGSHTALTSVNPGKFQLVMHTGSGGSTQLGGAAKTLEIDLPAPQNTATIDSWAAIVE